MLSGGMVRRLLACSALLAELCRGAATPALAAPRGASAPHSFKVGGRILRGKLKVICVIEGKWSNGDDLRYEAWDACSKMRVRTVPRSEYAGAVALGNKDDVGVADIPANSEVLELSNDFSGVLIFRDRNGAVREIMTRD